MKVLIFYKHKKGRNDKYNAKKFPAISICNYMSRCVTERITYLDREGGTEGLSPPWLLLTLVDLDKDFVLLVLRGDVFADLLLRADLEKI